MIPASLWSLGSSRTGHVRDWKQASPTLLILMEQRAVSRAATWTRCSIGCFFFWQNPRTRKQQASRCEPSSWGHTAYSFGKRSAFSYLPRQYTLHTVLGKQIGKRLCGGGPCRFAFRDAYRYAFF